MSNTYLTTNADVNDAYLAQASKDDGMSAEQFAQWHYDNYGKNENRDGWGASPAGGGGMLGQAGSADPAPGGTSAQVKSYLQDNPQLAEEYWKGGYAADKGMTLDEYVISDWANKGAKDGYGISLQSSGAYGYDAIKNDVYQSAFSEEQQQAIAKTYVDAFAANPHDFYGGGAVKVIAGMQDYGVSTQELAGAVAKYGQQYAPKNSGAEGVMSPTFISNFIARRSKEEGLGEGFGGESAKGIQATREATTQERDIVEWQRAMSGAGKYRNMNGSNVPGAIMADMQNSRSSPYITQEELNNAKRTIDSGSAYYMGAGGQWQDALKNPNWREDIAQSVASNKSSEAAKISAGAGKISAFAVGGTEPGSKNAPGKSVQQLAPGLSMNGVRPTAAGQQPSSAAVAAAKAQALQPTQIASTQIPSSVNQNDFGVNQKYAAEIKSDRASQALYSAYKQDLARIDANTSLSAQQRDAAKQQAAQKADRLLSYRKGV